VLPTVLPRIGKWEHPEGAPLQPSSIYDFMHACQRLLIPPFMLLPVEDAVVQFLAG
jgi:hypothetical protein